MNQKKEKPLSRQEIQKAILEYNFLHSSSFYQIAKDLERGREKREISDEMNPLQFYEDMSNGELLKKRELKLMKGIDYI